MRQLRRRVFRSLLLGFIAWQAASAQETLSWKEIREKFNSDNPALQAGQIGVQEFKAAETTAYLRPNPTMTLNADQVDPFTASPFRPVYNALYVGTFNYLHERQHKRELRLDSAQQATGIAASNQDDLERNLLFGLRDAFVRTLQAKAIADLAKENLAYYDKIIAVNQDRYKAGDISQIDLNRVELQRVQFQTDVVNAQVNLRTAKIALLSILNDKTPVDQFDTSGSFDFSDQVTPLDELHKIAADARPDLQAALKSVEKARTDHQLANANGSTDPTFGVDFGRNPPLDHYAGVSVTIPLRIFDRNQGEKARTALDIDRNQKIQNATEIGIYRDVDSSYAALQSTLALIHPYRDKYLNQASQVRESVSFAYNHGAASLLDFLDAQKNYRDIQLNYLNLIGSYLSSANQLNFAVGREVIQ